MCGAHSALGLDETERVVWPRLRERLRQPGALMALMRGVLGGDAEVGVVATVTPEGVAKPVALLTPPVIAAEIDLAGPPGGPLGDVRPGKIGDYDVEVLVDPQLDPARPIAVLVTPWIQENLTMYGRQLWHRRH